MDNISFKTILHKGTKGDKGTAGVNFEIPVNGIIGYDGEVVPEGYEQTTAPSGSVTLITKAITQNGTYSAEDDNADGYDEVSVDVQPNLTTKTITQNGTYDAEDDNAEGYSSVNVNLPLATKTITENGAYNAADDFAAGYSRVIVSVSGGNVNYEKLVYGAQALQWTTGDNILSTLDKGINYDEYLSYNTTTRKFTVLKDFNAIITGWVYFYDTAAYASYPAQGYLKINGSYTYYSTYCNSSRDAVAYSSGGIAKAVQLKAGDTVGVGTTNDMGKPTQRIKIYLVDEDLIQPFSDICNFSNAF